MIRILFVCHGNTLICPFQGGTIGAKCGKSRLSESLETTKILRLMIDR